MFTLAKTFVGVHWLWVLKVGLAFACLNLLIQRYRRNGRSFSPADFGVAIILGVVWTIFLILSHASQGAIEVVFAISLGYVIQEVVNLIWSGTAPPQTGSPKSSP